MRRGRQEAEIYSICFDLKGQWLACSSDRSTIHVWCVNVKLDQPSSIKLSDEEAKGDDENEHDEDRPKNQKKWGLLKSIVPYFDSE